MAMLFLNDEHVRIKTYSANTKGGTSVLRIDVEVTDPMRLAFLLSELAEIEREQKERKAALQRVQRKAKERPQLAIAAPLLRIAHQRGDE